MKRTTITLTDDLAELLALEARRRQSNVSEVIRRLIADGLGRSESKPREIPWAGLFDDPGAPSGESLTEVLAERWADDIDRDRG